MATTGPDRDKAKRILNGLLSEVLSTEKTFSEGYSKLSYTANPNFYAEIRALAKSTNRDQRIACLTLLMIGQAADKFIPKQKAFMEAYDAFIKSQQNGAYDPALLKKALDAYQSYAKELNRLIFLYNKYNLDKFSLPKKVQAVFEKYYHTKGNKQGIGFYFIMPIQRPPRFVLLLSGAREQLDIIDKDGKLNQVITAWQQDAVKNGALANEEIEFVVPHVEDNLASTSDLEVVFKFREKAKNQVEALVIKQQAILPKGWKLVKDGNQFKIQDEKGVNILMVEMTKNHLHLKEMKHDLKLLSGQPYDLIKKFIVNMQEDLKLSAKIHTHDVAKMAYLQSLSDYRVGKVEKRAAAKLARMRGSERIQTSHIDLPVVAVANTQDVRQAFKSQIKHRLVPVLRQENVDSMQNQGMLQGEIKIKSDVPLLALKQYESALAAGFTPRFTKEAKKAVQRFVKDKSSRDVNEKQIKVAAPLNKDGTLDGHVVLDRILMAIEDGLNVEIHPKAIKALQKIDLQEAQFQVENDPSSLLRVLQLAPFGFKPILPKKESEKRQILKKLQALVASHPIILDSGSAARDLEVLKTLVQDFGIPAVLSTKVGKEKRLSVFLKEGDNQLNLAKLPASMQLEKSKEYAQLGFDVMVTVPIPNRQKAIVITSLNPTHAINTFASALNQGFYPSFDKETQDLIKNHSVDLRLTAKDPKVLLDNIRQAVQAGLSVELDEGQKKSVQRHIEKQNGSSKTHVPELKIMGENSVIIGKNIQLAQNIGINVDLSSIKPENLPAEKIECHMHYKLQKTWLFGIARRVPDFEETIEEERKLAAKNVKIKLAADITGAFQAFVDRNKNKEETEQIKALKAKMSALLQDVKNANVPLNDPLIFKIKHE